MANTLAPYVAVRPLAHADAEALLGAVRESVAQVSVWLPDFSGVQSLTDLQQWLLAQAAAREEGTAYHCAIVDQRDDSLLGGCGLTSLNRRHSFANLYYWVRSSRTGQGVAGAAARQLARWGLEHLGLQRVEIVVAVDNYASLRAAAKAGAVREAVLRNRLAHEDGATDAVMFSFIPADFAPEAGRA